MQAARVTGYDPKSLRNYAWVASRVQLSLRRDNLSYSHHELVAALEPDQQERWLRFASENRLSVEDLRMALRASRRTGEDAETSTDEDCCETVPLACPHCGGSLPFRLMGEGAVVALHRNGVSGGRESGLPRSALRRAGGGA